MAVTAHISEVDYDEEVIMSDLKNSFQMIESVKDRSEGIEESEELLNGVMKRRR